MLRTLTHRSKQGPKAQKRQKAVLQGAVHNGAAARTWRLASNSCLSCLRVLYSWSSIWFFSIILHPGTLTLWLMGISRLMCMPQAGAPDLDQIKVGLLAAAQAQPRLAGFQDIKTRSQLQTDGVCLC